MPRRILPRGSGAFVCVCARVFRCVPACVCARAARACVRACVRAGVCERVCARIFRDRLLACASSLPRRCERAAVRISCVIKRLYQRAMLSSGHSNGLYYNKVSTRAPRPESIRVNPSRSESIRVDPRKAFRTCYPPRAPPGPSASSCASGVLRL